jgi:hypothetical protein
MQAAQTSGKFAVPRWRMAAVILLPVDPTLLRQQATAPA